MLILVELIALKAVTFSLSPSATFSRHLQPPSATFSPSQIEDYRQQIELAKTEARQAKEQARQLVAKQVSEFRSSYPAGLEFGYKFQRGRTPFLVDAIYHDGRFS